MKKKLLISVGILAILVGGCKSLDCGCPMADSSCRETEVRSQLEVTSKKRDLLTPDACPLTPAKINSFESHPHSYQRICTD